MNAIPYDGPDEGSGSHEEGTEAFARARASPTAVLVQPQERGAVRGAPCPRRVRFLRRRACREGPGHQLEHDDGRGRRWRRSFAGCGCARRHHDRCHRQRCCITDGRGRGRAVVVRRRRGRVRRRRRCERDVRNGQRHQRQFSLHHRDLGQHGEGHALERDQGHQERDRRQEGGAPRRHRRRCRREELELFRPPRSATPARASQPGGSGSGSSSSGSGSSSTTGSSAVNSLFGSGGKGG